ncbi:MAG: hypothetical protein DMG28_15925 [Acidobacteria bacterium]|nr:MAG: hypothetical protein DMG28_15925 [Acidobacteriota bacterium]
MVTKIMKWVSITALLLTVFWHPSASLDFVVCAGAILVVLALFFIKQEIETYYGVDNRSKPESRVAVLSATANAGDANGRHHQHGNHADRASRPFAGILAIRKRALDLNL